MSKQQQQQSQQQPQPQQQQPATEKRRKFSTISRTSRASVSRSIQDNHPFNNGLVDSINSNSTAFIRSENSLRKVSAVNPSMVITTSSSNAEPTSTEQVALHAEEEAKLRSELRFFFMTPCEKWRYRRRLPMKIGIQLLKVIFVTALIIVYANYRAASVSYLKTLQTNLQHLYLDKWNPAYETPPYPPSSGAYALYTQQDFYDAIDYTCFQYNATQSLESDTFQMFRDGNLQLVPPRLCVKQYHSVNVYAWNRTVDVNFKTTEWCVDVKPVNTSAEQNVYDIRAFLAKEKNISGFLFDELERVTIDLAFLSVRPPFVDYGYWTSDCYLLNATIEFDNVAHTGQILISLDLHVGLSDCSNSIDNIQIKVSVYQHVLSGMVIAFCTLSSLLCLRSLRRGYRLMRTTARHFETTLGQPLAFGDRFEFVDLWFVLVICSDLSAICGAVMKSLIDLRVLHMYDWCAFVLGIACLLVWIGLLRYLVFFAGYSDLVLTMKKAGPNIVRYLICAITLFLGFVFCGWVVIGPYHFKMRTLSSTAECLFSLLNGDDMYATFANLTLDVASTYVEVFLRVYLYSFVSMFIYMVLAVFLSVILDVYETVKQTGSSTLRQTQAESSDMFKFIYRLDDDDSIAAKQVRDRPYLSRSVSQTLESNSGQADGDRGCTLSLICCNCVASIDDDADQ